MKKALSIKRLINSFSHAIEGIKDVYKEEPNMLVHTIAAILAIVFGFIFKISYLEWFFVIIMIVLVFASEVINSSIENFVDLVTSEYHIKAKKAKDEAAGFVFLMSIAALIIGLIIFIPKIIGIFR